MMTIWITSDELVFFLFGSKWPLTSSYLDVLCFVGLLYITNAINGSLLKVKGKSIYILRLGIVKKVIAIPLIIIAVNFNIETFLYTILFIGVFEFIINSYWSGRLVNFSMRMQLKSILPPFIVCLISAILIINIASYINFSPLPKLIFISVLNVCMVLLLSFLLRLKSFRIIQSLLIKDLMKKNSK
jgi:O-antigen/teichoic acid export membrane protein